MGKGTVHVALKMGKKRTPQGRALKGAFRRDLTCIIPTRSAVANTARRETMARAMKAIKKKKKFNYEEMKAGALSEDREVRKRVFIEYFESFHEFPSFLFDNEKTIDARLYQTTQDLINDITTSTALRAGVNALLTRLPS